MARGQAKKKEPERTAPKPEPSGRDDAPTEVVELDVPKVKAVVKVGLGKLVISWNSVKGASAYDIRLRRSELNPALLAERSVDKGTKTEFTNYPIGPVGVPQVKVRAIAEDGLSPWSDWISSLHDLGGDE
jgi:hypothetical protein